MSDASGTEGYLLDNLGFGSGLISRGQDLVYEAWADPANTLSYFRPSQLAAAGYGGGTGLANIQIGGQGESDYSRRQLAPDFAQWLRANDYTISNEAQDGVDRYQGVIADRNGNAVVRSDIVDTSDSLFGGLIDAGVLAVTGMGLANAAGLIGNAGAAGSVGSAASAPGWLAGVPAETLAAVEAAGASLTPASVVASTLPAAGLPGLTGGLLAGVPMEALQAVEAYSAANPVTMAEVAKTLPTFNVAPALPASTFNAAADSQAYNNAAGITGDAAAKAATAPATVNLTNAGGTMATAGGLQGASNLAAQAIRDATASAELGGGLLSQAGNTVGNVLQSGSSGAGSIADWMKANPTIGRLVMAGASSLLSGAGGSGGSSPAPVPSGPPVKWNSPIQQGLIAPVQQQMPGQFAPGGLLAQGHANSGLWRFMNGGG